MPMVCEISIEAYCRPNDVVRRLNNHATITMVAYVTVCAQLGPIYIIFDADSCHSTSD
jgi:hypothetical protein